MAPTDWFQNAIIYHLLIDRFAGVTSADRLRPEFLGGNLRAVVEKLPYLDELGINTLWLSPFCKTSAYHGYHVTDFLSIEPRFGTLADLRNLISSVHRSGMRVIADFVPNHCSSRHPFFQEARKDRQSRYVNWFLFERWPDDYLCFLDVKELPKLNLGHPETRGHIIGAARYWLSLGLDGFRLDHVIGPKHSFWKEFRREIKKDYPAAVLIGEAWLEGVTWRHLKTLQINRKYLRWMFGVSQEAIQREYYGELDGVLDFGFRNMIGPRLAHGRGTAPDRELRQLLRRRLRTYPRDYFLPTFLDNHDTNRFLYECGNEKEKLKAAARLQFSLNQPPIIYYGTEVGMTHELPVGTGGMHSDLQARQPMIWDHPDCDLLSFYKQLIRKRKGAAAAETSSKAPFAEASRCIPRT
ncbi:MAG: alpha-amylase family glycosyl hydrolase [Syntrophales bacterium]